MKLIDLLVQELPKLGGWPNGANFIACDNDGAVDSYVNEPVIDDTGENYRDSRGEGYFEKLIPKVNPTPDDWEGSIINREQYESALAASKTPVWDGKGIPPVGSVVEYDATPGGWTPIEIVARAEGATFIVWKDHPKYKGADIMRGVVSPERFRPIQSEEDKKRDAAGKAIFDAINWAQDGEMIPDERRMEDYRKAYDAIAAGKIPGVKLDD